MAIRLSNDYFLTSVQRFGRHAEELKRSLFQGYHTWNTTQVLLLNCIHEIYGVLSARNIALHQQCIDVDDICDIKGYVNQLVDQIRDEVYNQYPSEVFLTGKADLLSKIRDDISWP